MKKENFTFKDSGGVEIFVYKWLPDDINCAKAVVQIVHGLAEHAGRYEAFAEFLASSGYIVYANDHRGHGKTAGSIENLGYAGEDGFNWMVKDLDELHDIIKNENQNLPVFMFGHSMGSMMAQMYMSLCGNKLKGVILSGTMGRQGVKLNLGIMIANNEIKKKDSRAQSEKLQKMTFGHYNDSFKPVRTEFDWLSRDTQEVDKYINDPLCGFASTASFYYYFFKGIKEIHKKEIMKNIPKDLPIYIMNGEMDPVGGNCKTVKSLIKDYERLGIKDVSYKFYKGGRHEMLNEVNKVEVMKDILNWLESHI